MHNPQPHPTSIDRQPTPQSQRELGTYGRLSRLSSDRQRRRQEGGACGEAEGVGVDVLSNASTPPATAKPDYYRQSPLAQVWAPRRACPSSAHSLAGAWRDT
jgi:hypothetical protein